MIRNLIHDPYVIDPTMSAMQAFRKLPEGVLAEVIDDKLYILPSPTLYHQYLCSDLSLDLANYVRRNKLGRVLAVPLDTYLEGPDKSVVIPDIVFISSSNMKLKAERRGHFGPPDLVIEILSPSTRKRDVTSKKALYERTGVKEYWVINPETRESQGFLRKPGGRFGEALVLNSKIHVRIFNKTFRF